MGTEFVFGKVGIEICIEITWLNFLLHMVKDILVFAVVSGFACPSCFYRLVSLFPKFYFFFLSVTILSPSELLLNSLHSFTCVSPRMKHSKTAEWIFRKIGFVEFYRNLLTIWLKSVKCDGNFP
jgi:hypothetical protein